ncbi:MAG: M15 family peptidase [Proteobacteria bacterium]|nr:M15 family peptidase [Pseudomonadota bacterium]MBU1387107.1 M15 family peptidase [Pseudomonadota bacterium]MBU1541576.1 M15 family peptidase [Pseudomonadota bacterium]MBU2429522.1 M15 family peptidase [Pseudomonadota bacterium]MBU2482533.1 M15 family peptidase [Pseudomonadota bacterium]
MSKFSLKSQDKLSTCHPLLQKLFNDVIKDYDCAIIDGHRARREQNVRYQQGRSKLKWPNSKHNPMPSMAVDAGPYFEDKGIPWDEPNQFYVFAGYVLSRAKDLGIQIRWGGDWDMDRDVNDQFFNDLAHYELLSTQKEG